MQNNQWSGEAETKKRFSFLPTDLPSDTSEAQLWSLAKLEVGLYEVQGSGNFVFWFTAQRGGNLLSFSKLSGCESGVVIVWES